MDISLLNDFESLHEQMTGWRRDLHAYPELGYEERRTSDLIAALLSEFGLEVSRDWAETGVVGTLRSGSSRRVIGLRADIDALPMTENNTFAHRSQRDECMHACGHDGHTAMLLGAARYLSENPNFDGTVHFIFQPAEEGPGGGERMIREGLFDQFDVDGVYGMHNWPGLDVGAFAARVGAMMASVDDFDITVTGKGCHAAMPQLGTDPFVAVEQLLSALYALPGRRFAATDGLVISVTQIHGGSAYNVIPESVALSGTVRALHKDVRNAVEPAIREIAAGVGQVTGTDIAINYKYDYPVTMNHPDETEYAARAAASLVGSGSVRRDLPPSLGAEDFSYMLQVKPGSYIWLGNGEKSAPLHSPDYDFNDAILPFGAAYWAKLVSERLKAAS